MWAISRGRPAPPGEMARPPKVRWSTKRSCGPPSVKVNLILRCGPAGSASSSSNICPDMPRWPTTASSESSANHRYLPRRRTSTTVRPVSAAAKSAPPAACRRTDRGWSTSTSPMVRPTTQRTSPARTVSTSGSSGIRNVLGFVLFALERSEGGLGGPLLSLFLGLAGHPAVALAGHDRPGGERLGVVGPGLVDVVVGYAQATLGGQLLQAGLPVQPGTETSGLGHHRVEQSADDLLGGGQAVLQVDRAQQGL